jgi:ABC-type nickel/cobalt efflux system permease component RcnA
MYGNNLLRQTILIFVFRAVTCAHPMGNFSVSHYARFDLRPQGVELTYALDLAELPTFELLQSWFLDGRDGSAIAARAEAKASDWLAGLKISVSGRPVASIFQRASAVVLNGAGGLPVLRVTITAALPATGGALEYEDLNYAARAGWKEVVIVPHEGVVLHMASHGSEDRSRVLVEYPADASIAPPQDVTAAFRWSRLETAHTRVPPSRVSPAPRAVEAAPPKPLSSQQRSNASGAVVRGDYLSRMLGGRDISAGMMIVGLCVAFGLGAMHALSPGHGKTIVAAYLVGSRGTVKHAVLLGALVTFTHTASVFALGLGVLFFEKYIVLERVIPVLGAISGLSIVVIGGMLLCERARALGHSAHRHDHCSHHHGHDRDHHHDHAGHIHAHVHSHGTPSHTHVPAGDITLSSLIALGLSSGLVPCPSALVLLLSSIALGRVVLGLTLLTAFSAGLALVLMAIGAMVLYARHLVPERTSVALPALRYAPVLSAAVVTALGLLMTGVSLGWIQPASFPG